MLGILVTVMMQSSSTTTSIIVGLVGADLVDVKWVHNIFSTRCRKMRAKSLAFSYIRVMIVIFQILWKSGCHILVTFPSHLKRLHSLLRFWLEKLNCGLYRWFYSWKNTTKQLFFSKFHFRNSYLWCLLFHWIWLEKLISVFFNEWKNTSNQLFSS